MARYRNRSVFTPGAGIGSRLPGILLALLLVLLVGGLIFVGLWEPEPPATTVERVIPDARFPR